jgi:hypothetical protein
MTIAPISPMSHQFQEFHIFALSQGKTRKHMKTVRNRLNQLTGVTAA